MARDVAIIGIGCTPFGEFWGRSFRDIFVEAGVEAIKDIGLHGGDIDLHGDDINELFVGNMSAGRFVEQEHIAALLADYAGLAHLNTPSTRVEAACASGGLALRMGVLAIASGHADIVVALGVEKMTDVSAQAATDMLTAAADREWEGFAGATFPGLYAMIAQKHIHEYGTTPEQLASVAVKNHHNATMNPKAQFRNEITVEAVLRSTMIADPLHILDCSPLSDGAATVVLAPADEARKYTDTPIYIKASAQASDTISLHDRADITTLAATVSAASRAYKMAGMAPADIDFVEVHDCFTIAEICAIEDLGFFPKGTGGKVTEDGVTAIDGDLPVNPSGGLKACGHPVGATGIKQVVEIVQQLRGQAATRFIHTPISSPHPPPVCPQLEIT
jgi:acetyl-CoA C-acetyltransferase